jgi:hypothetical protein
MNYQEQKEKIVAERDRAAQQITNLQAFIHQCNGKLLLLGDLEKEAGEGDAEQG